MTAIENENENVMSFPLSPEQQFLHLQHATDGSDRGTGSRPVSSGAWILRGELDTALLQECLDELVVRHEPLRTLIIARDGQWQQELHRPAPVPLTVESLPAGTTLSDAAQLFVHRCEERVFDGSVVPLLCADVGVVDAGCRVLVLTAHLPNVDLWSIDLLLDDLLACYRARREGAPVAEPGGRFRDHVAAASDVADEPDFAASVDHWRNTLRGARAHVLRADHPPSHAGRDAGTSYRRFHVRGLSEVVTAAARTARCTPYMVLLAAYLTHLERWSGRRDGVVWALTPGPGRRREATETTVGYFVNMRPIRVDLQDRRTTAETLAEVRRATIAAFRHEVPFVPLAGQIPDIVGGLEQSGMVVPGFVVSQNPAPDEDAGGEALSAEVVPRRLSQECGPDIPDDAVLWTLTMERDGLTGSVSFSSGRFDARTIQQMIDDFLDALHGLLDGSTDGRVAS